MTATLLWSNDPEFYDMVWGETETGKPIIKVGADPTKIIERFGLQESTHKEPWMIKSYAGSSGTHKYILVVFERITDEVRAFIGNLTT